ncbi:MAG TPA: hypothetical protein VGY53_12950 [Isosphaeraceae bacterium]|nr:hypothetical protein [Isosphaeraceae bacterium]
MPSSRRQMWLARIGMGLALLVIVLMFLTTRLDPVHRTVQGQTTIFTTAPWHSIVFLTPTLPMVFMTAVFWMQPGRIYKLFAVIVAGMAVWLIVVMAPLPSIHRAVLTPDGFALTIGAWYAPEHYLIRFDDVAFADIEDDPSDTSERTRHYVLHCDLKRPRQKRPVLIPICDLVKPALPQIISELKTHSVILGEPDTGLHVPPELAKALR